jgi:hypothetical protein
VYNTAGYLDNRSWKFDPAGRMTEWMETSTYLGSTRWDQGETLTFDGEGRTAKRLKRSRQWASPPSGWYEEPEYYIYSSVTGQKITELNPTGQKKKTSVYMGGTAIAEQSYTRGGNELPGHKSGSGVRFCDFSNMWRSTGQRYLK